MRRSGHRRRYRIRSRVAVDGVIAVRGVEQIVAIATGNPVISIGGLGLLLIDFVVAVAGTDNVIPVARVNDVVAA